MYPGQKKIDGKIDELNFQLILCFLVFNGKKNMIFQHHL